MNPVVPAVASMITSALPSLLMIGAGIVFGYFVGIVVINFLIPIVTNFMSLSINFLSIPVVGNVILWGQLVAILAVIIVRVGIGIKTIILDGTEDETSLVEYLYRTCTSIILVAALPSICAATIGLMDSMLSDVKLGVGEISRLTEISKSGFSVLTQLQTHEDMAAALVSSIFFLLALGMCVMCMYQQAKRQIEMGIVAIIAPWVSILSATEKDSGEVWGLLKSLFGMCICQWVQYVLMCIGLAWLYHYVGNIGSIYDINIADTTTTNWMTCFFIVAILGAAVGLPRMIDQYMFSSATHGGSALNVAAFMRFARSKGAANGNALGSLMQKKG